MASLNKVFLIGNVTREPEVKYTPKGSATCSLGLAINRTYNNSAGEKVEETCFVNVELWGRLAEIAAEYAKKGRSVHIEGRLRLDQWEDKETNAKRSALKVVGEAIQLLGQRKGGESESAEGVPPATRAVSNAPAAQEDDDIPF